jgi:hypothetical protein
LEPFRFTSCIQLPEMLGRRARDEQELLDLVEEVAIDSIYYHTAARSLRFEVLDAMFPNDFAAWVTREVRDQVLGERLGVVDPFDFRDLEAMRQEIVTTLDDHLSRISIVPRVIHGDPFYFMRSRMLEIPTGIEAHDLESFADALARVDPSAIYFHSVAARLKKNVPEGDFASWLGGAAGRPDLAARVGKLSPFSSSLEAMRQQLLAIVRDGIARPVTGQERAA